MQETTNKNDIDPGLAVLVILLRLHGISADANQLRHQFGLPEIGVPEMIRCAKSLGLKARVYATKWRRLPNTPLPGIAVLRDGGFLILGKAGDDKIVVQSPLSSRPALM